MDDAESNELLESLFEHCTAQRFQYRHKWRAGDLLLWDNRCTIHGRANFPQTARRILRRTTVIGERPF